MLQEEWDSLKENFENFTVLIIKRENPTKKWLVLFHPQNNFLLKEKEKEKEEEDSAI